ncbi:MAG TPA: hypothetical protein VG692_15315 [Gemmatimonadales bacterium]|nr:hypothetical protein [Gemmatimonadales bacterium]
MKLFNTIVPAGKSLPHNEDSGASLIIYPFTGSDEGNTMAELPNVKKWLGYIVNVGTAPSDKYNVPANPTTPVCVYVEGDGTTARISLVGPDDKPVSHDHLGCTGEEGDKHGPHAEWKKVKTCAGLYRFPPGQPPVKVTDKKLLGSLVEDQAAWISCASDGCCRVQP